ncbi:Cdc37 N terminal kinase binding-domain-containing protein [Pisolithus croceorrhizus]|nr:Cdc37 N terminal kinase binding-domain-containing protein [Pisolithus croceorrhizus]KAI6129619.1 Cdc37 N terminal kinase binding-domain-containing protein [Pisolithus croceorrhizus]
MPLNYSKWDQLELSDDSDIEGHPNVDKRSLIRWKQRDIHEKREARKLRIAALQAEIACNNVLAPRLRRIRERLAGEANADETQTTEWAEDSEDVRSLSGLPLFQHLVERLQTSPSPAKPPTNAKDQVTYDAMVLSLLLQIYDETKAHPNDEREKAILSCLDRHISQLPEHTKKLEKDLEAEIREQKKHITSEDIKEGWESKYVPPKPAPPPIKGAPSETPKKTATTTTTTYEVLNPGASSSATAQPAASTSSAEANADEDDADDELPELTPILTQFSRLPLWDYEASFSFIQRNREVFVGGASDALLVAAFRAQVDGKAKYAKQCVHQSLLLQYCDKLGKDGVRVFFQKMIGGDKRAIPVFVKDVEDTYAHIVTRAKAAASSSESGHKEQIQLVPENPNATISFNVPDGPPPDDLRLEGPGTEELNIEEVRRALTMRWQVFQSFPEPLKVALKDGTLEAVNKVLAGMEVSEAEDVVSKLDMTGIMNFAEGGIRDETANVVEVAEADGDGDGGGD